MKTIKKIVISYLWKIMLAMTLVVLVFSLFILRLHEQSLARDNAEETFFQVRQLLEQNQVELTEITEEYKQSCLNNAEAIAYMLQYNPEILLDVEEFRRIAQLVEVDEIHLFDSTGRIFTGTHPEYYGYTVDSGEQISFFKPMLTDKSLRLVQGVMPNTAEAKPVQYSAIWAPSGKFIVQIGMEPTSILKVTEKNELSYIFSLLKGNAGVDLYAVDPQTGEILGSTAVENTGKMLSSIGLSLTDMGKYKGGAHARVSGVNSYCVFTEESDMLIGYVLSNDVLYQSVVTYTIELILCLIFVDFIFVSAIIWYTNRFVIKDIHSTNEKLRSIAAGNLDERIEVRSSLEFSELSNHINEMIQSLLADTEKISYVLNRTNLQIGVYEYNQKMKGVRLTEQLPNILGLDAVTAKQLSGDYRLFREYMDALLENPVPGEDRVFRLTGEEDSYVKLEELTNDSSTLGIVMNVTEEIMTRKRIEAERDMDLLTGLYNRRGLENQLSTLFQTPDVLGCGALVVIDADGLKEINDHYGHSTGDAYLRQIAEAIRSVGTRGTLSARVGGDEFVLFLYGYDKENGPLDSIDKLKFIRNNSMAWLGRDVTVPLDFSIGYALTAGQFNYQSMLNEADERMYATKRERKKAAADRAAAAPSDSASAAETDEADRGEGL